MGRVRGNGGKIDAGVIAGQRSPIIEALQPHLRMRQVPERPMAARFSLVNPLGKPSKAPFRWKVTGPPQRRPIGPIDPGTVSGTPLAALYSGITSPIPHVLIDFGDRVDPHQASTVFTLTVSGGSLTEPLSQEVRVWSTYHALKQFGRLHLPVTERPVATGGQVTALAFRVRNPEAVPVHFTSRQIEHLALDPEAGTGALLAPEPTDVVVPAGEGVDVDLLLGTVPEGTTAVAVHLAGTSGSGMPARASAYFRVEASALRPVDVPPLRHVWDDPRLWREVDGLRVLDLDMARGLGVDEEILGAAIDMPVHYARDHNPSPREVGGACLPEHDADDETLVCAATGLTTTRMLPGVLLNAHKGDVLLFPGVADQPIAVMAGALDPPQLFSHCGIVSADHTEIRHCTASGEWMIDQVPITPEPFVPEDNMRFVWPGTVTQTADQMANGSEFEAPDGTMYTIGPWHLHRSFELVEPLVVKPPPDQEYADPTVRERLHAVADLALATEAHYRWFCHTDGDFGIPISAVGGADPVATAKPVPSMCSAFIRRVALLSGIKLERAPGSAPGTPVTAADLEAADTAPGAEAKVAAAGAAPGPTTDGLYLYDPVERLNAGKALQEFIIQETLDKVPFSFGVAAGAAERISNQIINSLGFDDPSKDSADADPQPWTQDVQPANTVFPSDILFWDAPSQGGVYGFAEPLRYQAPEMVTVPAYAWAAREGDGTVSGQVTDGGAGVPFADVWVGPAPGHGTSFRADGDGRFSFPLSASTVGVQHVLFATKDTRTGPGPAGAAVTVFTGETAEVDIELVGAPPDRRAVSVRGTIEVGDAVHDIEPFFLRVNVANPTERKQPIDDAGGFVWQWRLPFGGALGELQADVFVRATLANPAGFVTVSVRVTFDYIVPLTGAGQRSGSMAVGPGATVSREFPFSTGEHDIKVFLEVFNDQVT